MFMCLCFFTMFGVTIPVNTCLVSHVIVLSSKAYIFCTVTQHLLMTIYIATTLTTSLYIQFSVKNILTLYCI